MPFPWFSLQVKGQPAPGVSWLHQWKPVMGCRISGQGANGHYTTRPWLANSRCDSCCQLLGGGFLGRGQGLGGDPRAAFVVVPPEKPLTLSTERPYLRGRGFLLNGNLDPFRMSH